MAFTLFILDNDEIVSLPEHYATHPVFGKRLTPYDPENDEIEVDKVVIDNHELPLEQRISQVVVPAEDDTDDDKEND